MTIIPEPLESDKPTDILLTCMDYRIDTNYLLEKLHIPKAYVLRNAGAVVTEDVIRSMLIHQFLLAHNGDVTMWIVTHTGCGMNADGDDAIKREIESYPPIGQSPPFSLETFPTPQWGVRGSIKRIQSTPFLPVETHTVHGYVYNLDTKELILAYTMGE